MWSMYDPTQSRFLYYVFYMLHICALHFSKLLYCSRMPLQIRRNGLLSIFLSPDLRTYILLELCFRHICFIKHINEIDKFLPVT